MRKTNLTFLAGAAFLALLILTSPARADSWSTITSGWRPSNIVQSGGLIFAASEGGLIEVNPATGELFVLNDQDGFFTNFTTTIAVDSTTGYLWLGYNNGGIDIYDPVTDRFIQKIRDFYNDENVHTIHDICVVDGKAFVATNQGVSRLSYASDLDTWVVLDTYRAFGPWGRPTEMLRVAVRNDTLFAAGERGIAVGDLAQNLQDVTRWQVYDFYTDLGIPSDADTRIQQLRVVDGTLFAIAYFQGIFRWTGNGFQRFTSTDRAFGLTSDPDGNLYLAHFRGLYKLNDAGDDWEIIYPEFTPKFFDVTWANGAVWGAMDTDLRYFGGIAESRGSDLELYYPNTPGGDQVMRLGTAPDGSIWSGARSTIIAGIFHYDDGIWSPFARANSPEGKFNVGISMTSIGFDAYGGTWVGTWGEGCYYITRNELGQDTLMMFDALNSSLTGVGAPPQNYTVVSGFAADPAGGLWIGNQEAWDNKSLVYIPSDWFETPIDNRVDTTWVRYGRQQGFEMSTAGPIEIDSRGRLWIESIKPGSVDPMTVLDPKGTPEDPSDDEVFTVPVGSDQDDYVNVNSMVMAEDGILWLGTPAGLYWIDTNVESVSQARFNRVYGILGEAVNAVALDPLGQVWVGSDFGLSVVGRDRYSIVREYTTENGRAPSPLVDDRITALTVDPATGDVYVGTSIGISVIHTPFRNFADKLGEIRVAPQPFLSGPGQPNLTFGPESLVAGASVRIFTPSGRLCRSLTFEEAASDGWDGRTDDGGWAASGVYLIVVTDPSGTSNVGKAAVVRK